LVGGEKKYPVIAREKKGEGRYGHRENNMVFEPVRYAAPGLKVFKVEKKTRIRKGQKQKVERGGTFNHSFAEERKKYCLK